MATIDTEVDVDDMYWAMSRWEKEEMAEKLYEDGFIPKGLRDDIESVENRIATTANEQDLSDVLDKVWLNKMFLTTSDLEVLRRMSKKGLYSE
jgi:hypothetical protein